MASLDAARARFGAEAAHSDDVVWDREFIETPDLWIVLHNSRAFYETGNPLFALAGNAPYAVPKNGDEPFILETSRSIQEQLSERSQGVLHQHLEGWPDLDR
jgi:hypothetical protein